MDMFHPDDVETSVEAEVSKKKKAIDSLHSFLRVWARPLHCTNPALQLKLSLKKMVKGTICPLQNLGEKTRKEAHTKSFISEQKLQAKTERGKYIFLHV